MERRIVIAQALYALGALLSFFNNYWSIGLIVVVQLNYAVAPDSVHANAAQNGDLVHSGAGTLKCDAGLNVTLVPDIFEKAGTLPLHSRTPVEWAEAVLLEPVRLLADHAFLEKKAALNAMDLLNRWPGEWIPGWVETMTGVARDEAAHLAQVCRLLLRRGGQLERGHSNPYANDLRQLVRKGEMRTEPLDRLFVSALIEARSCERFSVLAIAARDAELGAFYKALFSSEFGHFKVFLRLAFRIEKRSVAEARWQNMLAAEAEILARQSPGPRIHSGWPIGASIKAGDARR